jgi:MOSC domain-containing protein YiiM
MKIVSTNIGDKKETLWKNKKVTTGIYKYPVNKSIFLDIEEVKGDEISDRKYHGGIDQAVYAYSLKHYDYWKSLYPNLNWNLGMFGENLTIDDIEETQIHVGDTFAVGEQFWNTTMCGVYFKVIKTGNVKAGDQFKQLKSVPENPTIADLLIKRKKEKDI